MKSKKSDAAVRAVLVLTLLIVLVGVAVDVNAQFKDVVIQAPRLGRGDVNGDGLLDLVVGGRIGAFPGVNAPAQMMRARVIVYPGSRDGRFGEPFAYDDLHVVDDVCVADLDGDGRWEIVAVGDGWLTVLRRSGSGWRLHRAVLPGRHTHRVAAGDIDGDGQPEILALAYRVDDDGEEKGRTEVLAFRGEGGGLVPIAGTVVDGHVGDLAVLPGLDSSTAAVLLEAGSGDEGGMLMTLVFDRGAWRTGSDLQLQTRVRVNSIIRRGREALVGLVDGRILGLQATSIGLRETVLLDAADPGLSDVLIFGVDREQTLVVGSVSGTVQRPLHP